MQVHRRVTLHQYVAYNQDTVQLLNTRRESAYRSKHSYLVSIIYTYKKDAWTAIQMGQVNGIEMLPCILTGFQCLHDLGERQWPNMDV